MPHCRSSVIQEEDGAVEHVISEERSSGRSCPDHADAETSHLPHPAATQAAFEPSRTTMSWTPRCCPGHAHQVAVIRTLGDDGSLWLVALAGCTPR